MIENSVTNDITFFLLPSEKVSLSHGDQIIFYDLGM
jgi:hypothetical protein